MTGPVNNNHRVQQQPARTPQKSTIRSREKKILIDFKKADQGIEKARSGAHAVGSKAAHGINDGLNSAKVDTTRKKDYGKIAVDVAKRGLGKVWNGAVSTVQTLGKGIYKTVLKPAGKLATKIASLPVKAFNGAVALIRTNFNMLKGIPEIAGKAWNGVKKVGGAIANGAKKVGGAIAKGAKAVGGAIAKGVKAVGGAIAKGVKAVGGAVAKGAKAVGNVVAKGARAVANGAKKVGGAIAKGAKAVGRGIANGAKAVGNAVASGAKAVWGWLTGS